MKSGTSSLFNYLIQHPLIVPPLRKELHFFSHGHHHGKSAGWYRAHFPLRAQLREGAITGEATPGYMFEPDVPERIAALVPRARLIVVLRNPVDRAISHYFHEVRMGREYLPIEDAMKIEEERLAAAQAAGEPGRETLLHACYKTRGIYADQIQRLRDAFPADQILVLDSGKLFRAPDEATDEALAFLGLPQLGGSFDFAVKNDGGARPSIPDQVLADLHDFFEPHNTRLAGLLGRVPDW